MAEYTIPRGATSQIIHVYIPDPGTGLGKTDITSATASLRVHRIADGGTSGSYSGANIGAITTSGTYVAPGAGKINIKHVSAGVYELHLDDALLSNATAKGITLTVTDDTNFSSVPIHIAFPPPVNVVNAANPSVALYTSAGVLVGSFAAASITPAAFLTTGDFTLNSLTLTGSGVVGLAVNSTNQHAMTIAAAGGTTKFGLFVSSASSGSGHAVQFTSTNGIGLHMAGASGTIPFYELVHDLWRVWVHGDTKDGGTPGGGTQTVGTGTEHYRDDDNNVTVVGPDPSTGGRTTTSTYAQGSTGYHPCPTLYTLFPDGSLVLP